MMKTGKSIFFLSFSVKRGLDCRVLTLSFWNRFIWYADWREKADRALRNFQLDITAGFDVLYLQSKGA